MHSPDTGSASLHFDPVLQTLDLLLCTSIQFARHWICFSPLRSIPPPLHLPHSASVQFSLHCICFSPLPSSSPDTSSASLHLDPVLHPLLLLFPPTSIQFSRHWICFSPL